MTELFFFPEELRVNPSYNTRLWGGEDEDRQAEVEKIKTLARQISAVGQIDTAVVLPPYGHHRQHTLLIGHRRRAAIAMLNQRRSASDPDAVLAKLRCRLASSVLADPYHEAAISNLSTSTPMEIAALLSTVSRRYDWVGQDGYQAMACWLGVPMAWVKAHLKLLRAERADQHALHRGKVTLESSVKLLEAQDTYRQAVLDMAQRIQQEGSAVSVARAVRAYEAQLPSRTKLYDHKNSKRPKNEFGIVIRHQAQT